MALTLDQIMSAPSDPELLNRHLQNLGYLQPPPAPAPLVPPATVGPLSPVTPHSDVAPMTPPVVSERGAMTPLLGRSREIALGATSQPVKPMAKPENIGATPEIGGIGGFTAPNTGILPTLSPRAPTPQESLTAGMEQHGTTPKEEGRRQFAELRPTVTATPGSADFYRQQIAQNEFEKQHPWGADISAHPGVLGKIGHVAGEIGQVAGGILNPTITAEIPGTRLNRAVNEAGETQNLEKAESRETAAKTAESEANLRGAQTKEAQAKLAKEGTEQSLEKDAEGNITGWKDGQGKLHSLTEEGTPQAIKDIAASTANKPHFEKGTNGDIVQVTPGKNGEAATSEVVYKGDPKVETDLTQRTVNGQEHHFLVNKKTGEDIKDLGAFKTEASPAQTIAKLKGDEEPVIGYDKNGVQHLMSRGEAQESGLQHVIKATPKDREDAMQNTSVLNDMGVKTRNLLASSAKALNQGAYEKGLMSTALTHGPDSLLTAGAIRMMSPESREYVQDVFSLREAALALPKMLTGGSRVSEIQAEALWKTVPGIGGDSKYAEKQLRKFDENLGRLWKKVPRVEGNEPERAFTSEAKGGGGAAGPPGPPAPGMKWQQNKKTGEYRQTRAE